MSENSIFLIGFFGVIILFEGFSLIEKYIDYLRYKANPKKEEENSYPNYPSYPNTNNFYWVEEIPVSKKNK